MWAAACAYPHRDLMIRNDTDQAFQLCLQVGETHLEGAWRAGKPPEVQYKIVERDARMEQASWGGYICHNQLFRQVWGEDGSLLREEFLFSNDAIMIYSPLLPAPQSE